MVIEFEASVAEYVRMRQVHPTQKLALMNGGRLRLTMHVGNLTQLTSWVLEWGKQARVLEPQELIDRVTEELQGALAAYAPRRPPMTPGRALSNEPQPPR